MEIIYRFTWTLCGAGCHYHYQLITSKYTWSELEMKTTGLTPQRSAIRNIHSPTAEFTPPLPSIFCEGKESCTGFSSGSASIKWCQTCMTRSVRLRLPSRSAKRGIAQTLNVRQSTSKKKTGLRQLRIHGISGSTSRFPSATIWLRLDGGPWDCSVVGGSVCLVLQYNLNNTQTRHFLHLAASIPGRFSAANNPLSKFLGWEDLA